MSTPSFQHLRLTLDGPLADLALNRPETRNAMTEAMGDEVAQAVAFLNSRSETRAVLVRGEGKAFCAGGDLGFLEDRLRDTPERNHQAMLAFYRRFLSIRELRAPTVALLQGPAMGAGLCFALACDLRLAAREATMGLNFVRLGLHPGMGATYLLPRLCGPQVAADLMLTGRTIDGAEAQRLGLVSQVVEGADLLARGRALAQQLCEAGPLAVAALKRSLLESPHRTLAESLEGEAQAQAQSYASQDLAEGVKAARERRPPRFSGR